MPHFLSARELAEQFACKIRNTADLEYVKGRIGSKTAFSPEDREKILRHIGLELPFSRIRISGGEPIFSSNDIFETDDESEDLVTQMIRYWIEFFQELDDAVGEIKQEALINIATFDSEWQHLEYPVWLTEAKDRIVVRFDTNGIVFGRDRFANLFYSELFKLFNENRLNHIHVQIDYSFKGATAKEYMWSQRKELPTTRANNDREVDLERHPQVRGLQNIFSNISEFCTKDAHFRDCVSVTIEKGIDHNPRWKLWLHYANSLDWQELADKLGIEFSDVVNHFDLNFGWYPKSKIYRYTRRGAIIEMTNGSETVDVTSVSIPDLLNFRRQHKDSADFRILVYPVGHKVELFKEKAKPKKEVSVPRSDQNFWIATGSEENLRIGLRDGLWGVRRTHEDLWTSVKKDDVLFFYCTRPVSGIVGYAKVVDKHVDVKPFWPNETSGQESRYPLRIRFQGIETVEDWRKDRKSLYGTGIGFFHGLNYVERHKEPVLLERIGLEVGP